jgi:hypothetical protein
MVAEVRGKESATESIYSRRGKVDPAKRSENYARFWGGISPVKCADQKRTPP